MNECQVSILNGNFEVELYSLTQCKETTNDHTTIFSKALIELNDEKFRCYNRCWSDQTPKEGLSVQICFKRVESGEKSTKVACGSGSILRLFFKRYGVFEPERKGSCTLGGQRLLYTFPWAADRIYCKI
jgi:hypothetical protein